MSRTSLLDVNITLSTSNANLSFTQPANRAILIDWTSNLGSPSWDLLRVKDNFISFPAQSQSRSILDFLQPPGMFYRVRVVEP